MQLSEKNRRDFQKEEKRPAKGDESEKVKERKIRENIRRIGLGSVEKCRTVFADKTGILLYNGYKHKRTLTDGACERSKKQEGLSC